MALNDPVPSTATDVFSRNVQDIDRIVNETANVTTRTGRVMESFPMSTERATTEADRAEAGAVTATTKANEAAFSELNAQQAAQTALATGNYEGRWSTLSGAYTAGISVEHNNIFWALRSNTSNIASIQPGVSAEWIAINGANLGTVATHDVGTAPNEVPLNSDLGTAATKNTDELVIPVNSVADLRNLEPTIDGQQVSVSEQYGFSCVSDLSDTTSQDDGENIFVTPGNKRWKRRVENIASYDDFNSANPKRAASAEQLNNIPSLSPVLNIGEPMILSVVESDVTNNGLINLFSIGVNGGFIRQQIITGRPSLGNSLPDDTCPVWRFGKIQRCEHVAAYKSTPSVTSGTWSPIVLTKPSWVVTNPTQVQFTIKRTSTTGDFLEFVTSEEDINILFGASPSSTTDASVEIIFDGNTVFSDTVDLSATTTNVIIKSIKNPFVGESVTVRITKGASGTYLFVGGVNASFDAIKYKDVDYLAYIIDADKEAISNAEGAMNYAMTCANGANALLFGGESHGGESIVSQKVVLDGIEIALVNGDVHVGRVLKIDRSSVIEWDVDNTVSVDASLMWTSNGTEFNGSFVCSDAFKAAVWYSPMLTFNRQTFTKMTYPELVMSADIPAGSRDIKQSSAVCFESTDNAKIDMVWTNSNQQAYDTAPFWSPHASVYLNNSKYYYNIARYSAVRPFSQKVVRTYR